MPFRFIHAADIHLDSPLAGLSAYADAPADALRTATRDAFAGLVDLAVAEAVDFMVLAGDLYDGSWKDFSTGIFFAEMMGRLHRAGIACYLLLGNHDAESEMTRQLQLPPNVRRFRADRAETFEIEALQVALHGRSFKHAATTDNLAAGYPAPRPGWFNIGVLHTALQGHADHARYAPCTPQELAALGYQYFALGHVHEHAVTTVGGTTLAFPGNLQGRHAREPGPRGALLVSADGGQLTNVQRVHTDVLRWWVLDVDVSTARTLDDAVQAAGQRLRALPAELGWGLPLAVRVRLTGRSAAHGALFTAATQLRAELLAQAAMAAGSDALWIEKVQLHTEPALDADTLRARGDAVAQLQQALDQACADPDLLAAIADELQALAAKLLRPVADAVPELALAQGGDVAALVQQVKASLLARVDGAGAAN